ncbi:DUF2382 domain-containing protein [Saccharothrix syringae]|uniref:DUF2382 domain-containing protein n=1 Tax=Saccharothrix syringae TaxID=103733 RepID=A0A5Q0H8J9_SACSY|nr:PRC and DUF2382 domain-containing protein [Saccharothrix syringae]QFZ22546.1 DUF2382 domain-containing protein [Saccharothrix syringae]
MINQAEVDRLYDCEVIDERGERIGPVKQVWLDDRDGRPVWASVHTGLFGLKETFVPIQDADMGNGTITVHVDKQKVKDAPKIDVDDQHMSQEQQDELYAYYDLIPGRRSGEHDRLPASGRAAGTGHTGTGRSAMGRDAMGRQTGRHAGRPGDDAVTRYEEDVQVGTRDVEAERVRLVKHTVTEQRDVTVPVEREEFRVVREPVRGEPTGRPFADEEAEVFLHRQEPVVEKTAKPVEQVRLEKETRTDQQHVRGQVRKEEVDVQRDQRPER